MPRVAGESSQYRTVFVRPDGSIAGDGPSFTSVTETLSVLSKPALLAWFWKEGLRGVASMVQEDRLEGSTIDWRDPEEIEAELKARKLTPWQTSRTAMSRGTDIHAYAERAMRGEEIDTETVPLEQRGYVKALLSWHHARGQHIEPVFSEETVWCQCGYGIGGTLDLAYRTRFVVNGSLTIADFKTGKGVYPGAHLQVAAYGHCLVCSGKAERVDRTEIIRFAEDGSFEVVAGRADFERDYLPVLATFKAMQRLNGYKEERWH